MITLNTKDTTRGLLVDRPSFSEEETIYEPPASLFVRGAMRRKHAARAAIFLFACVLSYANAALAAEPGAVRGRVVVPNNNGPVVAYLESHPALGAATATLGPPPDAPALAKKSATITQRDTEFLPDAVIVRKGARVTFPNKDKVYHNVFSVSPGNEFDLGLFRGGERRTISMRRPGEVDVYCNIHPNMAAKVLVVPNRFHAVADASGAFAIEGVPAGRYVLVGWSATHEPQRREVVVEAGGAARVEMTLQPRAAESRHHLNKEGQPYGRYK